MLSSRARLTLLPALLLLAAGALNGSDPPIVPLEEVRPGQRGHGLSVFSGSSPDRFEVEVLGVLRNVRPGASYILARLSGRNLEETGVIQGMSGSPVYLEDRLAGAVAFAWPFSQEAVAGITPIERMRGLIEAGPEAAPAARGSMPFALEAIVRGELGREALAERLAPLREGPLDQTRSGVQWSAVGFGELSRGILSEGLGPVAAAGDASREEAAELVPGSSVSGLLVDGDLRLAATGTVTDRLQDQVLAFGHAFLGLGPMRVPMASSEVISVLSSRFSSFKIANVGKVVGAFDLDHAAGMRGRLGAQAPMVPLTVNLKGSDQRQVNLRVAEIPILTPTLVAISVLGSLEVDPQAAGSQAIDLVARFNLGGRDELEIRQSFDGFNAPMDMVLHMLALTGYLLQNRLEDVDLRSLEVDLAWSREPRTAQLVGAHAARTVVRPGDRVPVNCDLVAYRGEPFRRSLELVLPTGLPDGRYSLLVGDGVSVDAARLAIEKSSPVNFRQALELLGSLHSRKELAVLGLFPGSGLAVAGEVLPQLPESVRSLWRAAASGSAVPLQLAVAQQDEVALEVPLEGLVRIDLQVERREPLTGAEAGGEESGAEPPAGRVGGGAVPPGAGGTGADSSEGSEDGGGRD